MGKIRIEESFALLNYETTSHTVYFELTILNPELHSENSKLKEFFLIGRDASMFSDEFQANVKRKTMIC